MKKSIKLTVLFSFSLLFLFPGKILAQKSRWKLIFEEQFDKNGVPNPANWSYCTRRGSDWNKYLKTSPLTTKVENGNLVLRAIKKPSKAIDDVPYWTGGIESRKKVNFMYGKIEVRAKFNSGQGTFPAIWMMPEDQTDGWPACGEIDIMEHLNYENKIYQTIHSNYANTLHIRNKPLYGSTANVNPNTYNIYGLEWYPDRLDFLVNGEISFTYPRITTDKKGQWPFDKKFYVILNQAAGGSWGGAINDAHLPFQMEVDWVKIYDINEESTYIHPAWEGTPVANDTHWENTYVQKIRTMGCKTNINYSANERIDGHYLLLPDTIRVEENSDFNLLLEAFSLGDYTENEVLQDLRYTCAYVFADFDGDKKFEVVKDRIGNVPPTHSVGGNIDVMNIDVPLHSPQIKTDKVGRIRVIYDNAWKDRYASDLPVKEGCVYDLIVKTVKEKTAVKDIKNAPFQVNREQKNIVLRNLPQKSNISIFDLTGREVLIVPQTKQSVFKIEGYKGLHIVRVILSNGDVFSTKL